MKVDFIPNFLQPESFLEMSRRRRRDVKSFTEDGFVQAAEIIGEHIDLPDRIRIGFFDEDANSYGRAYRNNLVEIHTDFFLEPELVEDLSYIQGLAAHELSHLIHWRLFPWGDDRSFFAGAVMEGKAEHVAVEVAGDCWRQNVLPDPPSELELEAFYDRHIGRGRAVAAIKEKLIRPGSDTVSAVPEQQYSLGFELTQNVMDYMDTDTVFGVHDMSVEAFRAVSRAAMSPGLRSKFNDSETGDSE